MDDIEFNYIGEDDSAEQVEDLNEDYEPRSTRVNAEGKRIRGTDLVWKKMMNFNTPEAFLESNLLEEINICTTQTLKMSIIK